MKKIRTNFSHNDMATYLINLIIPVLDKCSDDTTPHPQQNQVAREAFSRLNDIVNAGGKIPWRVMQEAWREWRNMDASDRMCILEGWDAPLKFPTKKELIEATNQSYATRFLVMEGSTERIMIELQVTAHREAPVVLMVREGTPREEALKALAGMAQRLEASWEFLVRLKPDGYMILHPETQNEVNQVRPWPTPWPNRT